MHHDRCNVFKASKVGRGARREEGDEFSLLSVSTEPIMVQLTEDFFKT
jgi:hypothetical protein